MKKLPLILGSIVFITFLVFGIKFIKTKYFDLSAAVIDSVATTYSGTITMAHGDDFKNKKTYIDYYLNTLDGKSLKINFTSLPPENIDGSQVSFFGIQNGTQVDVDPNKLKIISINQSQKPNPSNITITQKKLAVIFVNFQNDTSQPISPVYAKQRIFLDPASVPGSVNGYFKESSLNKFKFTGSIDPNGDVFGWYTLPIMNGPSFDFNQIEALSNQAAAIDGFIKTNYFTVMYVFPHTSALLADAYYVGFGIFMNDGGTNPEHMIHELGHSLGLSHAHSLLCKDSNGNPSILSKICTPDEYGDPFDVMGNAWRHRHFNNDYKSFLNFLSPNVIGNITSTGLYTLYPSNTTSTASLLRGLEIPIESYGNKKSSYYIEYRKSYGVFDDFLSSDPVVNGVSIRFKKHTIANTANNIYEFEDSYLIDSHPQTSTFEDAPFLAGSIFNDTDRGITVSVLPPTTPNPAFLQVQINITKQPWLCIKNDPLVVLNPSTQNTIVGGSLNYNVSITNQDNINCPPSVYSIESYSPYQPYLSSENSSFIFNIKNPLVNSVLPGTTQNYNVTMSRPSTKNLLYELGSHTFYLFIKDSFWNKFLMPVVGIYNIVPGPSIINSTSK